MALVRVTAAKDFRTAANALSTTGAGPGFSLPPSTAAPQTFFAGLHLTTVSLGTTARMLAMLIQNSSSSGFGTVATRATFTLSTVPGAEWAAPVASLSTDMPWWRASWSLSTGVSTGGTWRGLAYMGLR